jgi:hypothetical protein
MTIQDKAMKILAFIFILLMSTTSFAQNSQLSQLDGEWYSNEWKYGYKLTNGVGIATSTNSPNFKIGDTIIFLKVTSNNNFEGTQIYKDGNFYKITVTRQPNDTLLFRGERNVSWIMTRRDKETEYAANTIANTISTFAAPSAPLSSALTRQDKLPPCQGMRVTLWHMCTGTFTRADGSKYVGEFKDGDANGQGTFIWADGAKYVGEYKDGNENGQGVFTSADGSKHVGAYKDGKGSGQGTFTWANGDRYVGEFKDGKRNGLGTFSWADDGAKYVGEFKDDSKFGQGTFTLDGNKYVGEFKHGKRNGQGTHTWANGAKYVGEYIDGKRNGQGIYTFSDGSKYVGEYKDGKPNGIGMEFDPKGVVVRSGRWADGIFSMIVIPPTTSSTSDQKTLVERAKQGNAQAQFEYGMTFISETNIEIQPRIALKWFAEAAKQGHGPAQRQIESMFDLGARMSVMESPIQLK